jgi:hypothetical protein
VRRAAVVLALIALAVLAAWLLWPVDEPAVRDARPGAAPSPADETTPAAKRTPRAREPAALSAPETPEEAPGASDVPPAPETDAKLDQKTFDVVVLRPDGSPAVGADVVLRGERLWPAKAWSGWTRAVTDTQGRATLPYPASAPVYARLGADAGWTRAVDSEVQRAKPAEIRLRPSIVVRGRTVDSDGLLVAGATVLATVWLVGAGGELVMQATSGSDGTFETLPIPLRKGYGSPVIELAASSPGLVPASASVTPGDATKAPVVLTLYRGGTLRGRLVRADGRPVRNAVVQIAGTELSESSRSDGRFVLRLPRDECAVIAHDEHTEASSSVFRPAAGKWGAARRLGTFRGDAGDRDVGDVVLGEGRPLRGVVVLSNGEPVARAQVESRLSGETVFTAYSDSAGAFELPLSADAHDIVATEPSRDVSLWEPRQGTVNGVHGGDPDVRVTVGGMGVVLKLRADDGLKLDGRVANLSVAVTLRDDERSFPRGRSSSDAKLDGVRIELTQVGAWDVTVEATGFELAHVEGVDVRADRDTEIEVRLRRKP